MPAPSTLLIEACCATIDRFCTLKKRPSLSTWNRMQSRISTGSMPMACSTLQSCARRAESPAPPGMTGAPDGRGAFPVSLIRVSSLASCPGINVRRSHGR